MGHHNHKNLTEQAIQSISRLSQAHNYFLLNYGLPEDIGKGQSPHTIVVVCSDSRVQMNQIGPTTKEEVEISYDPTNNLFVVRNAGNRIDHEFLSANGTYAADHIPTTGLYFILGHTACGAVTGASLMALDEIKQERRDLNQYLDSLKLFLSGNTQGMKTKSGIEVYNNNHVVGLSGLSELNVDLQVGMALRLYGDLIDAGKITVIGGMLDLNKVYQGTKKPGQISITNFNGEIDPKKIQETLEGKLNSGFIIERLTDGISPKEMKPIIYQTTYHLGK